VKRQSIIVFIQRKELEILKEINEYMKRPA